MHFPKQGEYSTANKSTRFAPLWYPYLNLLTFTSFLYESEPGKSWKVSKIPGFRCKPKVSHACINELRMNFLDGVKKAYVHVFKMIFPSFFKDKLKLQVSRRTILVCSENVTKENVCSENVTKESLTSTRLSVESWNFTLLV